ncbi:hypothetical protein GGI20_004574 [Coemansia sp. BCRC 34301]|nr:hypothetical protein GGI20_004574 [Coemansia sp. BCRC 34301]
MPAFAQIQLNCGSVTVTFDVPQDQEAMTNDLSRSFNPDPAEIASAIELHATFIRHCVDSNNNAAALAIFTSFALAYGTATRDIHVTVQAHGLDESSARRRFLPLPSLPQD